jgi:hypothetical protein
MRGYSTNEERIATVWEEQNTINKPPPSPQDPVMFDLKTLVKETCKIECVKLHDGKMSAIYETTSGFRFPVPVAEMQNGTFNAEERGFTLMKWIKRSLTLLTAEEPSTDCAHGVAFIDCTLCAPQIAGAGITGVVVDLTK